MQYQNNYYKFSIFPKTLIQGISTRYFGSIKDKTGFYKENLKKVAKSLNIKSENIVFPKQKHTGNVEIINARLAEASAKQTGMTEADGFITKERGVFLGVVTADCLPIMFFDTKTKITGIVHAGYKGLLNKILENIISEFIKLGADTKNILVGIGPGIGSCCYAVPMERIDKFIKLYPKCKDVYQKKENDFFLNLTSVVKHVLNNLGINNSNIEESGICTRDNMDRFYSYRGDSKESFGEFASIIGISFL